MTKTITFADFNSKAAQATQKLLDYYEDKQSGYVEKLLDAKRDDWRSRGFNVQSRNIIKSIVDKSGLLFNAPPALAIFGKGETKGASDPTFEDVMDHADWLEKFQNVDVYTRLLKSVVLLQQKYVPEERLTVGGTYKFNARNGDALMLTLLTQANSVVRTDITGNRITELAFLCDQDTNFNEPWSYRYINADVIEDWRVDGEEEHLIKSVPNPDALVPASVFYDVKTPRAGFWVNLPEDVVSFQENLNLYLCDMQFAVAQQINKPLFIDTDIESTSDSGAPLIPYAPPGHTNAGDEQWSQLPSMGTKSIGGLGSVVKLTPGMTGNTPMVKFEGPDTRLKELHDILSAQVRDIASDWDVSIKAEGGAKANSGFQVIVEEMDNLALREKRAQSFQAGLRRFYNITQRLYPELTEGVLKAEFAPPSLPVNKLDNEQVWQIRSTSIAFSPVDRLMDEGYTEEDAFEKVRKNITIFQALGLPIPGSTPLPTPSPTNMQQRGGNPRNPENG